MLVPCVCTDNNSKSAINCNNGKFLWYHVSVCSTDWMGIPTKGFPNHRLAGYNDCSWVLGIITCWVEKKYETFSVRENHWNFFPGWKTLTYSCRLWDSNPCPPNNSVAVITPRLAHHLDHSATEHWHSNVMGEKVEKKSNLKRIRGS